MSDTPFETQELINSFLAEEKAKRTGRETVRTKNTVVSSEGKPRCMSCGQVERWAMDRGILVENRGGKHGKHLVAPNGKHCPLPDHGSRDIPTGTLRNIQNFIHNNGISS